MGLEMLQLQNKVLSKLKASPAQLRETNRRLALAFLGMLLYVLVGGIVFVKMEAPMEGIEVESYEEFQQEWTERLLEKGFKETEIQGLFAGIRDSALRGILFAEGNATVATTRWSFGQAVFFAAALVTTVGYGQVSPRTQHGKMFTIVYCLIGIPMALALISALALRLREPSAWMRERLNVKFGHLFHARHLQLLHIAVVATSVLMASFILPSLFFWALEGDWSYLDALYFCFVSLTTIGLGETIPGDRPDQSFRALYKLVTAIYIVFGLCSMMLLLATLYEMPQLNLVRFFIASGKGEGGGGGGGGGESEGVGTTTAPGPAEAEERGHLSNGGGGVGRYGAGRYVEVEGMDGGGEWPSWSSGPATPTPGSAAFRMGGIAHQPYYQ